MPCTSGARLRMRRRSGRTTGAQLLRVRVRGASRISVQVDAAIDIEPETVGRKGSEINAATIRLAGDSRQALTRRLGFDL